MFGEKEPHAGEWIEVQAHGQTVLIRGGGSELRAEVARLKEALKESAEKGINIMSADRNKAREILELSERNKILREDNAALRRALEQYKDLSLDRAAGQISTRDEVIKNQAAQIQRINTKRVEAEKEIDRLVWELSKVSAWHADIARRGSLASGTEGIMKARKDLRRAGDIISDVLRTL